MIYYWFHLFCIYMCGKFVWKKVDLGEDLSRTRRVSILDCEALKYMSNTRYFYYMDFIRFEILFRTKLYDNTFKKGIYPTLGSQKIIYKKPLKRWSKFKITLVLEGWDDKWVYHKQIFTQNNQVYAVGITKVAFLKKNKTQNIRKIIADSGLKNPEMNPPQEVLNMFKDDYEILKGVEIK